MKNNLFIAIFMMCMTHVIAQTRNHRLNITVGGNLNHYNGNLGNSFFRFNTTAFAGVQANFGLYLNKSFDLNIGAGAGHFGYCQTQSDVVRLAHLELKCPGCTDQLGMGELRSLIISGNVSARYKFANGYLLKEDAKFAPYVYAGFGINSLSDNMKRNCVTEGIHFSFNTGAGIRYNISDRFHVGYNLGVGCFVGKKVYALEEVHPNEVDDHHDEVEQMERRKDFILQNALFVGINF